MFTSTPFSWIGGRELRSSCGGRVDTTTMTDTCVSPPVKAHGVRMGACNHTTTTVKQFCSHPRGGRIKPQVKPSLTLRQGLQEVGHTNYRNLACMCACGYGETQTQTHTQRDTEINRAQQCRQCQRILGNMSLTHQWIVFRQHVHSVWRRCT